MQDHDWCFCGSLGTRLVSRWYMVRYSMPLEHIGLYWNTCSTFLPLGVIYSVIYYVFMYTYLRIYLCYHVAPVFIHQECNWTRWTMDPATSAFPVHSCSISIPLIPCWTAELAYASARASSGITRQWGKAEELDNNALHKPANWAFLYPPPPMWEPSHSPTMIWACQNKQISLEESVASRMIL